MLKADAFELERHEFVNRFGIGGLGVARGIENVLEIIQRDFSFAIDVDHVSEFLQGAEDEEGINPEGKELADGDLLAEDQVEHQEQNTAAQRVDGCALDETQTAQILYLLEFELKDFSRYPVETDHFLDRKSVG